MKRQSPLFLGIIILIIFILVLVAGGLGYLILSSGHTQSHIVKPTSSTIKAYPLSAIPPPGSSRTIFKDSMFGYEITYPTDWHIKVAISDNSETVHASYNVLVGPEVYPFDVKCSPNSNGLDAQSWWQQYSNAKGVMTTLKSGVSAYVIKGAGETNYTAYTFTHGTSICTIGASEANKANADIINNVINTWQWLR